MVHEEHHDHAEKGAKQRDPLVIVPGIQLTFRDGKSHSLEAWSPARRFCDAGVKDAKVDQGIGGDKEVAEESADHIEVANEDADERDGKDKDVAT